jgi:hypothetical protein
VAAPVGKHARDRHGGKMPRGGVETDVAPPWQIHAPQLRREPCPEANNARRVRRRKDSDAQSWGDENSAGKWVSCQQRNLQDTLGIQSLTTNRGGQSNRRPSRWACNKASVQSWKKWLRSLNPKSRTIRSNVSRCSRRTLVVRLPCIFWVNPGSVFILEIQ